MIGQVLKISSKIKADLILAISMMILFAANNTQIRIQVRQNKFTHTYIKKKGRSMSGISMRILDSYIHIPIPTNNALS